MKKISNKLKKQLYDEAFYKAEKLQRDKQYKEAILAYKEAINIDPESYLAYNNMAILYFQHKYNNAVKYYKESISSYIYTDNDYKYFYDALFLSGKYKELVKYINANYNSYQPDTDFLIQISNKLIEINQDNNAKKILKLISISDKNALFAYQQNFLINCKNKYNQKYIIKNKKTVTSLAEFINIINEIKQNDNNAINIYRGQTNGYLPLLPSLYRNKLLIKNEKNIIQDFNLKAEAYFNRELELFDKIDKIALMQHHGIPTRLLDFSESPLIALFFALESANTDNYSVAPCVYVINIKAFQHNRDGCLLSAKQIESNNEDNIYNKNIDICAFTPKLKSKRLTAQKGVFVLFNKNEALELAIPDKYITKIEIPITSVTHMYQELNNVGITPSTIYPDFVGLATEIKNPRKFVDNRKQQETLTTISLSKIAENLLKSSINEK